MLEVEIQKQCKQYLDLKGVFCWRQNNTPVPTPDGHFRRFTGKRGVPDIIAVIRGFFVGIEVKQPTGKQSEFQLQFEQELLAAGGIYLLVHSVDELAKDLQEVEQEISKRLDRKKRTPSVSTSPLGPETHDLFQ
jgi:hypothetical protein